MNQVADNYKDEIKSRMLDEEQFVRLTMKGKVRDHTIPCPWHQVIVRPVMIKNERHLQFSYFTDKQDFTKNYKGVQAVEKLDELLVLPLSVLSIQSKDEDLLVQITNKGKAIFHCSVPASSKREPDLAHDVSKKLPLPADRPDAFLQTSGIMNEQGKVSPTMQTKFSQINEFLKLLDHTGELERLEKRPVHILDCGCGSAYLSLATYHYLNNIRGIPAHLVGVDVNETLIEKDNASSEQLGFTDACFQKSAIRDYKPDVPPNIVLALHACDTATDEAIAQGIKWQSRLILCAPCCHHDLNQQLHATGPNPFSPVLQHGILKERMADILTDAFRALVLRIMGYATDVVEFISPEHTDKNLMIRAVRRANLDNREFVLEYLALKELWGVTPYIEKLLGEVGVSFVGTNER